MRQGCSEEFCILWKCIWLPDSKCYNIQKMYKTSKTHEVSAVIRSGHYFMLNDAKPVVSKTVRSRMCNYVDIAKAMFSKGATSNGRTLNFTFVARKSKLLSIGQNNYQRFMIGYIPSLRTKYLKYGEKTYIPSLHSEMSALFRLGLEDCSNLDFYNIRIDKNNRCKNSAPCANCFRILNIVGYKHIYFYDDDMDICEVWFVRLGKTWNVGGMRDLGKADFTQTEDCSFRVSGDVSGNTLDLHLRSAIMEVSRGSELFLSDGKSFALLFTVWKRNWQPRRIVYT